MPWPAWPRATRWPSPSSCCATCCDRAHRYAASSSSSHSSRSHGSSATRLPSWAWPSSPPSSCRERSSPRRRRPSKPLPGRWTSVSPEHLFVAVLIANMIGFGGLSSLPVLRGQLLAAGLQADALLLQSLAVSNITPGPNGLYVVVVGYFVGGPAGAAIATVAVLLPPLLVLPLERVRSRLIHLRRFCATMVALSLSVVALLALSSGSLVVHASTDTVGMLMAPVGVVLLLLRVPPLVGVLVALIAGALMGP